MSSISLKHPFSRKAGTGQSVQQYPAVGMNAGRQPFDLTKMQSEPIRRRKRRKLLLWSLPCVLIVGAVALWFLLPTPLTREAIANYNHQNYSSSRHWLTPLTWTSPQPFVIAFNSGTVDTQLGNYTRAQTELTRALVLAAPNQRCMVLQNLVISLTDHAASLNLQAKSEDAATYATEAANLMSNNTKCFNILKPPPKQNNQGGGGGGGGGAQFQQILTSAQQDQLQQKNEQGQQSEQQDFLQNTVNPNSPAYKPW